MEELDHCELSVLLIEPSPTQQTILINKLNNEGVYSIEVVTGMEQALAQVSKYPPDLIVSNLYYEDGTAADLLQKLREQDESFELPFILVTSEQKREHLEVFKQSGILAILGKPFEQKELEKALKSAVSFVNKEDLYFENYDVNTLRVALVDDSTLARNSINRVLKNLGLNNVTQFVDGCFAIEYLENNEIDLLITDYNMPKVNGIELTKFMKNSGEHSHVPILMVSSEERDAHLAKVHEVGVDAILNKPFDAIKIKEILQKMFDY
jgi:two-component system chemotaxis response regulator CheY